MAAYSCDASGIVKRHVPETGTAWVQALADPSARHELSLARVTRVEATADMTGRGRGGMLAGGSALAILAQFRHDADHQFKEPDRAQRVIDMVHPASSLRATLPLLGRHHGLPLAAA